VVRPLLGFSSALVLAALTACDNLGEELCERYCEEETSPPAPTSTELTEVTAIDGDWRGTLPSGLALSLRLLRGRVVGYSVDTTADFIIATYNGTYMIDDEYFVAEIRAYGPDHSTLEHLRQGTFFAASRIAQNEPLTIMYTDLSGVVRSVELEPYTDPQFQFEAPASLELVDGVWSQTRNGNPIESLTVMSDGSFFGQYANGCAYSGTGSVIDPGYNLYAVELEVAACTTPTASGDYAGYAKLGQPRDGESSDVLLMLTFGGAESAGSREYSMVSFYRREE